MLKNKLRDLRFDMRMEQQDFASYLGANRTQYHKWEHNRGQPSLEWALRIAKKTGRQVEDIFVIEE